MSVLEIIQNCWTHHFLWVLGAFPSWVKHPWCETDYSLHLTSDSSSKVDLKVRTQNGRQITAPLPSNCVNLYVHSVSLGTPYTTRSARTDPRGKFVEVQWFLGHSVLFVGARTSQFSILVLNRLILGTDSKKYLSLYWLRFVVQYLIQQISQSVINNPLSVTSITWERTILGEAGKCGKTWIEVGGQESDGDAEQIPCHEWDGRMYYYHLMSLIHVSTCTLSSSGRYINSIQILKIL
jgi:hypothetical protein